MRTVWILIVVLVLAALALWATLVPGTPGGGWLATPDTVSPDDDDLRSVEPFLEGARVRATTPHALLLRVTTPGGDVPPPGVIAALFTPPSLLAERAEHAGGEPPKDHRIDAEDFDGDTARVDGLHYRLWWLRVAAPGHDGVSRELVLPPVVDGEPPVVEVEMRPFAALTVRVFDADGAPVPKAHVRLREPDLAVRRQEHPLHIDDLAQVRAARTLQTGDDGRIELAFLPGAVPLTIAVAHPDLPPRVVETVAPPPGEHDELIVTLERPSGIRGTVDLTAFEAPAQAIILTDYHQDGRDSAFQARVPIRADGSFHRKNVRPGRHLIQITARGQAHATTAVRRVDVPKGTTVDLGRIGPDAGRTARFLVHVEEPIPRRARVRAVLVEPGGETPATVMEFVLPIGIEHEVRGLPARRLACHFGLVSPTGDPLIGGHKEPRLELAGTADGTLHEVVFQARPPSPPAVRTTVIARPPRGVRPRDFVWRHHVLSEDGRLLSGYAHPMARVAKATMNTSGIDEPVRIYAFAHGEMAGPLRAEDLGKDATFEFTRWRPASVVTIRLLDEHGTPMAGVEMQGKPGRVPDLPGFIERTDAEGRVTWTVMPGVPLLVEAHHGEILSVPSLHVRAHELTAGGRIERTLQFPAGAR